VLTLSLSEEDIYLSLSNP